MGGLGVKVQHFPLTLLVVLTTLTLPCERDFERHSDLKKQKWQFSTTPLSSDAPHPANPYEIGMTIIS